MNQILFGGQASPSVLLLTITLLVAVAGRADIPGPDDGGAAAARAASGRLRPDHLRCEAKTDPLGIDVRKPRLSWILQAAGEEARGQRQTAYQILVATDRHKLATGRGDLWDSGVVKSDQNAQIVYAGAPLTSGRDCWWKVRVWDQDRQVSTWSQPARWSMGLLNPEDWSAQWIGYTFKANTDPKLPPATYWRQEIQTDKRVARATLYASALGAYVLHLNGQRIGHDYFNPGWPEFRKRVFYHTYEVTPLLQTGRNCLSAILSTGWYAGYIWAGPFNYGTTPKWLAQLHVEYVDGTSQTFGTDAQWKVAYGPLREADLQQGETYDARLEIPHWNLAGFVDTNWAGPDVVQPALPVKIERENLDAKLCAAPHPPVRRQREIRPVRLSCPQPGVYVFDLGESIAGWAKLKAHGPAGAKVVLRYSGMLKPEGTIYDDYLREARVTDSYILKGSAQEEVWEPQFTYHGFQFIQVTGYPGVPTLDSITGVACHADLERTGHFACSDARVNQLFRNCHDTIVANLVDLVSGCSDRAERLGWMGAGQMFDSCCYLYDMDAFLAKWMTDMVDAQSLGASGAFLQCSPIWGDIESPGWSDDGVALPYSLYRFYGNTRLIEDHYPSLTKYLDHLERSLTHYVRTGAVYHAHGEKFIGYGDWLAIVENRERHHDVLNTLWNGWSVSAMAELAQAVGREQDARKYQRLLAHMKKAFDQAYVSADGKVRDETQGQYALALYFGFLPPDKIPLAVQHLVDDIRLKSHTEARENPTKQPRLIPPGHLTTGFHSTRALLPVLSRYGQNALAYELLLRDTYPSWLYPVTLGATSTWERWDSWRPDVGFQDPRMNSFGMPHLMASVVEWLMGYAGGIRSEGAGFKRILIKPYPGPGLSWVESSYASVNGRIAVQWKQMDEGAVSLRVTLPPNTSATVSVPTSGTQNATVRESGTIVWAQGKLRNPVAGITAARENDLGVDFQVGSGTYEFTSSVLASPAPSAAASSGTSAAASPSADPARHPGGFQYFVGVVGNPSVPDLRWSDDQLEQIKALGVNMVQLSIAWGNKPADEVLNLEDLDAGQREKFTFRIQQAKKHGLKTIAHFGIPRMVNYSPVQPACVLDPAVQQKYERLLADFMRDFPDVNDVLVYTFDQRAWLCSEFGPCPRCTGVPLDARLPDFLNRLNTTMQQCRPNTRLWWKPWELSKGQVVAILDQVNPEHFGLALNPSTSNEVYPFNDRSFKSDLGVKRLVQMAKERGIPVLGEFDHTLYKPLYLIEDFFPRLIYEQMVGWKELEGVVGVKEYYGFAPSTFSVNAALLRAWMKSPDAPLDILLREIAAPYGPQAAPLLCEAWEYVAQSVEAYPWDVTYLIGPLGLDRHWDGSHHWEPVDIPNATWDTPIWKANRRANFMLTEEDKAHPWVFEDTGLRLEDAAALGFKAVRYYDAALAAGSPQADEIRAQRDIVWKTARSLRAKSLHFLETLAAQNARVVRDHPRQFALATKRLEALLKKDVENQNGHAVVAQKLAEFQRDPKTWIEENFNPQRTDTKNLKLPAHETRATVDWSKWLEIEVEPR